MSRLAQEIKKFNEEFLPQIPVEVQTVMFNATKELKDKNISKNALKIGDIAKEFNLPNAVGKEVSLYKAIEQNDYVIITFYRGQWCPYCNMELHALQGINEELAKLNTTIIAISPETPDLSLSMQEKHNLEFEVLSDAHNKIAKEYGLVFSLNEELKPIYKKFDIDIEAANRDNSYELPMPATYILNKNKEIIFAFVDEDYTKRCEPQDILDAINKNK